MTSCLVQLNSTLFHIVRALWSLNSNGNLACYPGFHHNKVSDVLLMAKKWFMSMNTTQGFGTCRSQAIFLTNLPASSTLAASATSLHVHENSSCTSSCL